MLLNLSELRLLNRDKAVLNSTRGDLRFLGRLLLLLLFNQVAEVFDLSFGEGLFVRVHCEWFGESSGSILLR